MDFLKVISLEQAIEDITAHAPQVFSTTTTVPILESLGKILAQDIISTENVPAFPKSSVDGYAIIADNLSGASESSPAFLALAGQVKIGNDTDLSLTQGSCIEVPTGGIVPAGADAVAMVEYTEAFGNQIAISTNISPMENIVAIGDDIKTGEKIFHKGHTITPKDIGALAAIGVTQVAVYQPPTMSIISTGDELVDPGVSPLPMGKIRDISSYSLAATAEKYGLQRVNKAPILLADNLELLTSTLAAQMQIADIVILSGGSSYGKYDMTAAAINQVASPGVFVHGLAIKPGKPTIIAHDTATNTLIIGLPGHPVSAMIVFELLLSNLVATTTGAGTKRPIPATLDANVPADGGKLTVYPCNLVDNLAEGANFGDSAYIARPIFGKSATITSLTKSDGYFTIQSGVEGLIKGEKVMVHLL